MRSLNSLQASQIAGIGPSDKKRAIRRRIWIAPDPENNHPEKEQEDEYDNDSTSRRPRIRRRYCGRCHWLWQQRCWHHLSNNEGCGGCRWCFCTKKKNPVCRFLVLLVIFWCVQNGVSYLWRWWKWRQRFTLHPFVNQNTMPRWNRTLSGGSLHRRTSIAIFYNLYLGESPHFSKQILQEQLDQIAHSYVSTATSSLTLYMTTIGFIPKMLLPVESICNNYIESINNDNNNNLDFRPLNWTCIHAAHYKNATEIVTLSRLHEYCAVQANNVGDDDDHRQQQQQQQHLVLYLHNKGSLHPYPWQDRWRRTMTAAVTSHFCVESLLHQPGGGGSSCHACGMLFQPLPALHFPGNMWIAQCAYVNRLLSPEEYHIQRRPIDRWMEEQANRSTVFFPLEAHYTGRRRYESEHWLGSHPDLIPCDISQRSANLNYWLQTDRNYEEEFVGGMAPRHGWQNGDWIWYSYVWHNATLFRDVVARVQDVFLLRGVLFRFWSLYGSIPATDSWIWKWFPDGQTWKRALEENGVSSVLEHPESFLFSIDQTTGKYQVQFGPNRKT